MSAPVVRVDWGKGSGATCLQRGTKVCITCGNDTMILNPDGRPQHKMCAERLAEEAEGG